MKNRPSPILMAPAAQGGAALRFPPAERPPVDEHVVVPELTRDELIRGRRVVAQPALEPHGDVHSLVNAVIGPHVRAGYRPSVDLLTRVSSGSNFATDLSIRREGTDPETGRRYLEELSFEIVNEQSMRDVREKAEDLLARGVRRFFAVFVKRGGVAEWSAAKGEFEPLDLDGALDDPCFVRPLKVRALLDMAAGEAEIARALEQKGNPEIEAMKQRAAREGQREVLLDLLRVRFGELPASALARIESASAETLQTWARRLLTAGTLDEVLGA
ncbi:hypothetical protein [Sorangium sp. So ce131]|uniref:hypothetical protein n=1 Tax=Sorangium sp. So ce131 TaxID=3133282 RepID=UPI003F60481E